MLCEHDDANVSYISLGGRTTRCHLGGTGKQTGYDRVS